jgi:NAD(P)-dependent dehydrogenase (short-subunit alcohol dehydrogenase family)
VILHRTGALATRPFAAAAGKRLEQLTAADFQHTLGAVLVPAFVLSRAVAECMNPRGSGSVVLFSSMYGVVSPDPRIYHAPTAPNPIDYGASKAAVLQIARYFAVHYGPSGLRFNCITPGPLPNPGVQGTHPGFIADLNRKTALGRVGQNAEIVGPINPLPTQPPENPVSCQPPPRNQILAGTGRN